MEILTWVTIVYAIVLVLTLAVGLITILLTLMAVARKLGQIDAGLKQVRENTAPLNAGVEKLNDELGSLAGGLSVAESSFASANAHFQNALDAVAATSR